MKRRDMLRNSAALGLIAALPLSRSFAAQGAATVPPASHDVQRSNADAGTNKLNPPADGSSIPVAFLISDGAVVIDFCGPWEVFGNVMTGSRMGAFRRYTVAEAAQPVTVSGGMTIVPNYTLETAPPPKVIVIPAQSEPSAALLDWVRKTSPAADVTMSVCTGAFLLAATGLMKDKSMTTHHSAYAELALKFPDIHVKRGARFVEEGNLASAGGLSSGIDLALRVVERYFGREVAEQTAYYMEYQGEGWLNPDSNSIYAKARTSAPDHPLCPVCSMEVDPANAPKTVYKHITYYFCSLDHKSLFDKMPAQFVALLEKSST